MPLIDLTQTLFHQMPVFPGEERPSILEDKLPEDVTYVTFRLETNMHTGTHIDAPYHAKADSRTIDSYPLEMFCGKAKVLDIRGETDAKMRLEWEQAFRDFEIILFCTGHDKHWNTPVYYHNYPVISDEVVFALKETGVRIVGVDSPSPDKSPFTFHQHFLNRERFLVENLTKLDQLIAAEEIEFMAFPLKIRAEASLIRAVASYR
jgi:kynurenine formamidase